MDTIVELHLTTNRPSMLNSVWFNKLVGSVSRNPRHTSERATYMSFEVEGKTCHFIRLVNPYDRKQYSLCISRQVCQHSCADGLCHSVTPVSKFVLREKGGEFFCSSWFCALTGIKLNPTRSLVTFRGKDPIQWIEVHLEWLAPSTLNPVGKCIFYTRCIEHRKVPLTLM